MEKAERQIHEIASDDINEKVESMGFGWVVTHNDLDAMLDLPDIGLHVEKGTNKHFEDAASYKAKCIDKMPKVKALKDELLYKHKICLSPKTGVGYIILEPEAQISTEVERRVKHSHKYIKKTCDIVENTRIESLSDADRQRRNHAMHSLSFIESATNRESRRRIIDIDEMQKETQ